MKKSIKLLFALILLCISACTKPGETGVKDNSEQGRD